MQGLKNWRTLARGEVDLRVGNGAKVVALEIGDYSLTSITEIPEMEAPPPFFFNSSK